MNELLLRLLVGALRTVATPAVIWLNENNILTEDQTIKTITVVATLLLTLASMAWNKISSQRERNTALASTTVMTPSELKQTIASGTSAPAATPMTSVPRLTSTGDGR